MGSLFFALDVLDPCFKRLFRQRGSSSSRSEHVECSLGVEDSFHLFDTSAFGFFDKEECQGCHCEVQSSVEDEDVAAHRVDHVRCDEREQKVEQPLCRHRHGCPDLTDARWKDLNVGLVDLLFYGRMIRSPRPYMPREVGPS